ncbi:hypothetical protein HPP92_015785 [Vanilla planifolia]|uniref:Uncharacterized protein n=1 Tax=Vanilla planifolia TaxID=51239 RepID=A0A835QSU2_VANPL|nr:hypothetical protein HPP92_015785 [Vanilla planifolia]
MIARAIDVAYLTCSSRPISFDSTRRSRSLGAVGRASAGEQESPAGRKRANLWACRKEKVKLPEYTDRHGRPFCIGDFLRHPSGVQALLNSRALQELESLGPDIYRCTLQKIQFLAFEVAPVLELRVNSTSEDCTVEMISCKFEGSELIKGQNKLFSAFMRNHITWNAEHSSEPCLEVDVNLSVSLEIYTQPFSLLPAAAVENPGNLIMQGLIDRLVPLLAEQLLQDYATWVKMQKEAPITRRV